MKYGTYRGIPFEEMSLKSLDEAIHQISYYYGSFDPPKFPPFDYFRLHELKNDMINKSILIQNNG